MSERNKKTVGKINKALSEGNFELFFDFCADDFAFTIVGEKTIKGKEAARKYMASMAAESPAPPKITPVDPILADSDFVAARGNMSMKNKDGKEEHYSYCDIYRFRGDKIAELSSYVVKTESQSRTSGAGNR
jgi:ketosteroid isomerase-like protein